MANFSISGDAVTPAQKPASLWGEPSCLETAPGRTCMQRTLLFAAGTMLAVTSANAQQAVKIALIMYIRVSSPMLRRRWTMPSSLTSSSTATPLPERRSSSSVKTPVVQTRTLPSLWRMNLSYVTRSPFWPASCSRAPSGGRIVGMR